MTDVIQWLLESDEPWTRYRTRVDLLDQTEDDPEVRSARAEMLAHPGVQDMMAETATWGDRAFKHHNDAGYPIYKFSTLADFGVRADDPGLSAGVEAVMAHQSAEGVRSLPHRQRLRAQGTGAGSRPPGQPCGAHRR